MTTEKVNDSSPFALYSDLSKFANAVNYYLSYIELVAVPDSDKTINARPHFITESAVRFPLAEYLERRLNVSDLELEYNYRIIEPKRCDFKFTIRRSGDSKDDRCLAELKYVKSSISLQDFFDDIMRLHFARVFDEPDTKTFFIICGKTSDFNRHFRDKRIAELVEIQEKTNDNPYYTKQEKKGQYKTINKGTLGTDWLVFSDDNEHLMRVNNEQWEKFVSSHFYKVDSITKEPKEIITPIPIMPEVIRTKRISLTTGKNHSIGIWEVY